MKNTALAFAALFALTSFANAATMVVVDNPPGSADEANDGLPSYYYDAITGEFWLDGEGTGIGLVDAQSASGLFSDRSVPGGLFPVDTESRMSVVINAGTGSTLPDVRLANIGMGLTPDFLAQDLTLLWSAGFGNPNVETGLVWQGVPEPATAGLAGLAIAGVLGFRRRR
ncbi:hypothetical protein KOR34_44110 [Posidoniimonas corsicana]|uniref:Ice-binding protein C-terminal domain-containing protein n=1 Tax=Posidoniimonas corsicana TaxID=1938618 RepID=A0A5C5UZX3_9BACT|nr:PEP-CTERM sorting domain-containing protein [Posidoniimonas corsicana]TWT31037.1 hypothetical protein KOR34_44110 [Posidoniimonas corsicana]